MTPRIVFRTDGSRARGLGHLMRCVALAQALRRRHAECVFLSVDDAALAIVERAGFNVRRLPAAEPPSRLGPTLEDLHGLDPAVVVVDSYDFDAGQRAAFASVARFLVRIDDGRGDPEPTDVVVNGNLYGGQAAYSNALRRLVGPRYALLREEFAATPSTSDRSGTLVTMGGADPPGATLQVLDALAAVPSARPIRVLVGPAFAHRAALDAWLGRNPGAATVLENPSVADLRKAFLHSRLAVSAGGTTVLELASCATPAVILILADNQEPVAQAAAAAGGGVVAGRIERFDRAGFVALVQGLLKDTARLEAMGSAMRRLVDGQGADRVATEILEHWASADDAVRLRRARPEDSRAIWTWRNDEVTRAQSIQTEPVPWETHVTWFARTLEDPNRSLLVVEAKEGPVGVVRLDLAADGSQAEVNINMSPQSRGRGFGTRALEKAVAYARGGLGIARVTARIRRENEASKRAFSKAGFHQFQDGDVTWWAHGPAPAAPARKAAS